jgi:GAF domain-containing protein
MKRRSKAGGEPTKPQRPKTPKPTRRNAPKVEPRSSVAEENEVARLAHERDEALELQTAASEVLRVISASPGELEVVFQAMLERAVRLCDAKFGNIYRWDGDALHLVASQNVPAAFVQARGGSSLRPSPQTPTGRMIVNKTVVHSADMREEKAYADRDPYIVAGVELGGVRTVLMVPMLKKNELIGAFSVYRQEVRPFTDKQIELVQNFAAQAVIAVENARLLNELRQRTTDLTEALGQQTATSEVLEVISSSQGDLQPVFDAMLSNATRICQASLGNLVLYEDGGFRNVALHGAPTAYRELRAREPVVKPNPAHGLGRLASTKQVVHVTDIMLEPPEARGGLALLAGARTLLNVPMLKEQILVGAIGIYRQEVRPFTDKQIELVQNFAAQAVIAIENARLLNELRQRTTDLTHRTTDLTEALEQQTATSDVLKVISGSPGDLQPVFDIMLANATRLCEATHGHVWTFDGEQMYAVAVRGDAPFVKWLQDHNPVRPIPGSAADRIVRGERFVHVADRRQEPAYRDNQTFRRLVDTSGIRASLSVALRKGETLLGMINVYRQDVRPFTDNQIKLVEDFASQAVIAIENARLLNELRQSLEEQTATSDVLRVISSSPGELEPVFAAMLASATHICEAEFGNLFLREEDAFRAVAWHGEPTYVNTWRGPALTIKTDLADIPLARLAATKQRVHVADLRQEAAYKAGFEHLVALIDKGGARTLLIVPMLKERTLVGAIAIYRQEVRPFTDKQIALVENFAAQAVIAIENARLLRELRERTEEVEGLNQHLEQRVTDQVDEIERMSRLRRFLPRQVADLIVASGAEKQLESHRREITALFCDLRGFTGFSESADPEDVMTVLREYHEALGASIIKYSGTLERYAGDGVMVVFNDPVPVENPALQAVLMALEMRDAIEALTETWRRWGHEIGFGIGIAHGFATLGTIGFEGRFDYAAIGTVSNVASRLCDEAKPGQILISPRVLMAVENTVTVEAVGEFALKGIRRPLAAYNVVAAVSPTM